MPITFQQVIDQFVAGEKEGYSGTAKNHGNLRIEEDKLIHYNTPILERYGDKFIFNITRYSIQTGQLQKKIKTSIEEEKRIEVKRVPAGTKDSLKAYIEK